MGSDYGAADCFLFFDVASSLPLFVNYATGRRTWTFCGRRDARINREQKYNNTLPKGIFNNIINFQTIAGVRTIKLLTYVTSRVLSGWYLYLLPIDTWLVRTEVQQSSQLQIYSIYIKRKTYLVASTCHL